MSDLKNQSTPNQDKDKDKRVETAEGAKGAEGAEGAEDIQPSQPQKKTNPQGSKDTNQSEVKGKKKDKGIEKEGSSSAKAQPKKVDEKEAQEQFEGFMKQLGEQVGKLQKDLAQQRDANIELLAEMESLKKRTQRQSEQDKKFALEGFAKSLLPALDSLQLSLNQPNQDLQTLQKGVMMSLELFNKGLKESGFEWVEPLEGEELNPEYHEAMTMLAHPKLKTNQIIQTAQAGIKLHDRIIRSAKVIVAS